jgi:hypothetical protein
MKVYPLIHSRTGGCDYSSKFAVRPPNFSDAEIKWARSKILPATRNIGLFNGIRRIVASDGKICIAGVVCIMKYFVNNCLTGDEQKAAQPYTGIEGTKYGVFLGCAFKKGEAPEITYSDLWKWFEKYLLPYWNRKYFDGVKSEQENCDSLSRADYDFSPTEKCFDAQIYDAAAFDDAELFNMYLFETAKRDIAFCSNVENIQRVEEGTYNAVTTSAGNISTLKAHWEKELDRRKKETERRRQEEQRRLEEECRRKEEQQRREREESTEKKTPITTSTPTQTAQTSGKYLLPFLLVALIILAAIAYWRMQQPESDSKLHSFLKTNMILIWRTEIPKLNASWRKFDEQAL